MHTFSTSGHSNSIDGLRAFAILPVLIGHAFPLVLPGGFIGVDIFFVISGFLITAMIIRKAQAGQFDLFDFYKRRVLRIFPALFVVLLVTFVASLIILPPLQLREMGQAMVASSVFLSNLLFWMKSGYFDAAAELNPLVHTWSLAVEEQFYIVAPFLAFLVVWRRNAISVFLAAIGLMSLVLATMTNDIVPSTWFYFTLNRVFELVIGCLAGVMVTLDPPRGRLLQSQAAASVLSAVALCVLLWSYFSFNPQSHHPGVMTLFPVTATALLLVLHDRDTLIQRFLQFRVFVGIGLVSYSLYLIHQPLLALLRISTFDDPGSALLCLALLVSLALSWVSWRFVERPFRQYDRFSLRQTFLGGAGAMILIAGAGFVSYLSNGLPQRYDPSVRAMAQPSPASDAGEMTISAGPNIALVGDSHAKMLLDPIRRLTAGQGVETTLYTLGGCPPIPGFDNAWRNLEGPRCSVHNAQIQDKLLALPEETTVILAARWANYLRPPSHYNAFGQAVALASRSLFPSQQTGWTTDVREAATVSLRARIAQLAARGHRVVVMGSVPVQRYNAVNSAFLLNGDRVEIERRSLDKPTHDLNNASALKMLREATQDLDNVELHDVSAMMCNERTCSMLLDGKIAYTDDNHLNGWGADPVVRALLGISSQ